MNNPNQKIEVRDKALRRQLQRLAETPGGLRKPFTRFAQYMRVVTDDTFENLRRGGTYRGVMWRYFAPQYTRKTDGVTVPAWGGVPRLYGSGTVLGRLRPSGARVAAGDAIMQDTMTMRSRAALVTRMDRYMARLGVQGVNYAPAQQAMRPFLFFTNKDANVLSGILRDYVAGVA